MSEAAVPSAGRRFVDAMVVGDSQRGSKNAPELTPRQRQLTKLWSHYRCQSYDDRIVAWDGTEHKDSLESDFMSRRPWMAPGFVDLGGQTLSLRYRRPSAPYYLVNQITNRFTSLLFSQRKHPKINVEGDEDTEDFLEASVKVSRLWSVAMKLRAFGGSMGASALSFCFREGKPVFQAHDPRWTTPTFSERHAGELDLLEIRYAYSVHNPSTNKPEWYWYYRRIDRRYDVVWANVPVTDHEPEWSLLPCETVTDHSYGFVPARWVQNLPVEECLDGDPDCFGAYEMIEEMDRLTAQGNKGTLSNCDPTLLISTDAEMNGVDKGSENAIKLMKGDMAQYLELNGSGPETAFKAADRLEVRIMRHTQCTLDSHTSDVSKTATEVVTTQSGMWSKGDILREQYGETCIRPLLVDYLRACRMILGTKVRLADGRLATQTITLPPRAVRDDRTGKVLRFEPRRLGESNDVSLQWFEYHEPTVDDVSKAVTAAREAKDAGLIDREHASRFVSKHFGVEEVGAMLARMDTEQAQASQDEYSSFVSARYAGTGVSAPTIAAGTEESVQDTALNGAQVQALSMILDRVATGVLPVQAAKAQIQASFPGVRLSTVIEMLLPFLQRAAGLPDTITPTEGLSALVREEER